MKDTWDAKTSVKNEKEAIQWAKDIIAEDVSDHANLREKIKSHEEINSIVTTKPTKTFEENWVYKIYKEYSKQITDVPSYAYLAIDRAENEKQLNYNFLFVQFAFLIYTNETIPMMTLYTNSAVHTPAMFETFVIR